MMIQIAIWLLNLQSDLSYCVTEVSGDCLVTLSSLFCSLAFIKRTAVIDADKPVSSQLRVLTLSEDSPYETLHSFISNAVAPFFKSYIRESGKADR